MSDKIVIDLTESFANAGSSVAFQREVHLSDDLLPYPNAKLDKVILDFDVTFVKPDVTIEGTITCVVDGYCDRCLRSVASSISFPIQQTFYLEGTEDEFADYVYSGSKLDATKAVCDEILLSLPSSLLCEQECKGLCPKCGVNLNEQQCDCDTTRENPFSVLKDLKF